MLDLFAGVGGLGLEALSRGAARGGPRRRGSPGPCASCGAGSTGSAPQARASPCSGTLLRGRRPMGPSTSSSSIRPSNSGRGRPGRTCSSAPSGCWPRTVSPALKIPVAGWSWGRAWHVVNRRTFGQVALGTRGPRPEAGVTRGARRAVKERPRRGRWRVGRRGRSGRPPTSSNPGALHALRPASHPERLPGRRRPSGTPSGRDRRHLAARGRRGGTAAHRHGPPQGPP